tara:strand:+ start:233 stop:499 length:267 start_codon:yes stop_codon:yes gene_type:complete
MTNIFDKTEAMRVLRNMVKKGLIKVSDLNTPPDGWYLSNGFERQLGTGKWVYLEKTNNGARSAIKRKDLPKWKNLLTGKITVDPTKDA